MYLAFRFHGILPSRYMETGYGERQVLRAFLHYEVEDRNKEAGEPEGGA